MNEKRAYKRLTVDEARVMLGWHDRPDHEVEEFLDSLRAYLGQYMDDYFT